MEEKKLSYEELEKVARQLSEQNSIHDTLVDILLERYSQSVVEKLAGLNAISFFKGNL